MAPLEVVLEGNSSITRQPERAGLAFSIHTTGPSQEIVSKETIEASNEISRAFKELSPKTETGETIAGSPVTSFSSTSLQTSSHIPTDKSGDPLPVVYSATISLNALFQDFTKLGEIVGKLISLPNVRIKSLDWRLTEATQKALSSESRQEAMRDAVQKANDYTGVIGREVIAVDINELRGGGKFDLHNAYQYQQSMQQMQMQQQLVAQASPHQSSTVEVPASSLNFNPGTSLDLSPQLIRYTNAVQVKFQAAHN